MRKCVLYALAFLIAILFAGCGTEDKGTGKHGQSAKNTETNANGQAVTAITPTDEIVELENGFSVVRYDGNYGFDQFLSEGGALLEKDMGPKNRKRI